MDMTDVSPSNGAPYQRAETPRTTVVVVNEPAKPSTTKKEETNSESGSSNAKEPNLRDEMVHDGPSSFKISQLYRYATTFDKVLLGIGIITTGANGALFPLMAIVFGNVMTGFSTTPVDFDKINSASLNYLYIAIFLFFTDYISYVAFFYSAERQMKALRSEALRHMLYMDISWYDANDALQLSSRLTGDTVRIKDGMGHKLGDAFRYTIQFIVGIIIGFVRGWDITLVMACVVPVMAISLSWLIKTFTVMSEFAQKVYAEAGSIAEETLGSIRTVASLNGEQKAIQKFEKKVIEAEEQNIQLNKLSAVVFSLFLGSLWIMYSAGLWRLWIMYSAGLWYGGWKASKGDTTPGDVFAAFFGVMMGTSSLGQISPCITAVSKATGAAEELFAILDTTSAIDAEKEDEGIVPETCQGKIEAVNVNFTYPSPCCVSGGKIQLRVEPDLIWG
ncbi:ATP-binding cassette (ABC) Superfamily [Phytophthora palmivora]|uniref:ATP-binding cassette (ABC) Superfamily n=1 Tax=Phytophthora palmivora TaxID=4796 RepID=A0A2P4XRP1_9STRA|nr:ATP-binding cassette (ABC) Superfamily [Phytophthora palmivora]